MRKLKSFIIFLSLAYSSLSVSAEDCSDWCSCGETYAEFKASHFGIAENCELDPNPKQGIKKYHVKMDKDENDKVNIVLLVQSHSDLLKKEFLIPDEFKDLINPAKGTITCSKNSLTIISSRPYSKKTYELKLTWDGKKFIVSTTKASDPSAEEVERAEALLLKGTYEGACPLNDILYPHKYISGEQLKALLNSSYEAVRRNLQKPKTQSDFTRYSVRTRSLLQGIVCFAELIGQSSDLENNESMQWLSTFKSY